MYPTLQQFADLFRLYGAELVGAFFVAALISISSARSVSKDGFTCLSWGFYGIVLRNIALIGVPLLRPHFPQIPPLTAAVADVVLTSLATGFFFVGAMKNMQLFFSSRLFIALFVPILIGGGVLSLIYLQAFLVRLTDIYLITIFFVVSLSFYLIREKVYGGVLKAVGSGFLALGLCYIYVLTELFQPAWGLLTLGYAIITLVIFAVQVKSMDLYYTKAATLLENEKAQRSQILEAFPYPLIVSQLRDDSIIFVNESAQALFGIKAEEIQTFRFSDYFVSLEVRSSLLERLKKDQVVQAFEIQMKHPVHGTLLWVELSSRVIELDDEIALLSTFKDITDQKVAEENLFEQASTDPLTGLFNRRQFETLSSYALRVAERYKTPYAVMMMDIDFFKKINDSYGHESGDIVLKKLAQTIQTALRKSDIVGRFGGEEFVVFLPQVNAEQALIVAERMRNSVEKTQIDILKKKINITVSIGLTTIQAAQIAILVKQADVALYQSKKNGRNKVSLFHEDMLEQTSAAEVKAPPIPPPRIAS